MYEILEWIRSLFYAVREALSHLMEMLCCYWSEVFVNTGKTIFAASAKSSSLSSDMFLVRETWMITYATCIQSRNKFIWLIKQYKVENSYIRTRHRRDSTDNRPHLDSQLNDRLLDATADRRIKTRKNWVPVSSDEDLVMRLKRQNKVLKFWLIYEFSTSYSTCIQVSCTSFSSDVSLTIRYCSLIVISMMTDRWLLQVSMLYLTWCVSCHRLGDSQSCHSVMRQLLRWNLLFMRSSKQTQHMHGLY